MVVSIASRPPTAAAADERDALQDLARYLAACPESEIRLVGPQGEPLRLPATAVRLLREVVAALAREEAVSILPIRKVISTFQAAQILNVSHAHLLRLLDEGAIPADGADASPGLDRDAVLAYKRVRDAARRDGLRDLVRMSEELGLYDEERSAPAPSNDDP